MNDTVHILYDINMLIVVICGMDDLCRFGHAMTTVGDKLFVFGGGTNLDEERTEYFNNMHVLQSELHGACT